jgi:hypothetical protein
MIRYIPHIEIDKKRYDQCISQSSNGLIYAFSWYLDSVSPGWDLLEYDNYTAVMPLPNRKKFGIYYIFTPHYVQQLGVFGDDTNNKLLQEFIKNIPRKFRLIELKFNEKNTITKNKSLSIRKNFLLKIETDYSVIVNNYHRNCLRNIKKAENAGLHSGKTIQSDEFSRFIYNNLREQIKDLEHKDLELLEKITSEVIRRNMGEIACVYDEKDRLCAAGSFLYSRERLIFSVCASSSEGLKQQAMYYLVDQQIRRYAEKYSVLDFSGSEIKGIAYFNSTFGAEAVSYPFLEINRLPLVIRMITGKI